MKENQTEKSKEWRNTFQEGKGHLIIGPRARFSVTPYVRLLGDIDYRIFKVPYPPLDFLVIFETELSPHNAHANKRRNECVIVNARLCYRVATFWKIREKSENIISLESQGIAVKLMAETGR